jgi:hypothetical protein
MGRHGVAAVARRRRLPHRSRPVGARKSVVGPELRVRSLATRIASLSGSMHAVITNASMIVGLPEWWGARHFERMETPHSESTPRRLVLSGGFTIIDGQQRRLHDRARSLGFPDLHSYLVARCQDDASLSQLAGELDTTVDIVRRLLTQAGIYRSPTSPPAPPRHRPAPHRPCRRPRLPKPAGVSDRSRYRASMVTCAGRRRAGHRQEQSQGSAGPPWAASHQVAVHRSGDPSLRAPQAIPRGHPTRFGCDG